VVLFNPWRPAGKNFLSRIYATTADKAFLHWKGGRVQITAETGKARMEIESVLAGHGINLLLCKNLYDLESQLGAAGLIQEHTGFKKTTVTDYSFRDLSPEELYEESRSLVAGKSTSGKCLFSASTMRNAVVAVDHREPDELFRLLGKSDLNVIQKNLTEGDVLIQSQADDSRVMLIERKTVTDLYTGITSENRHCHDQAERYWTLANEAAKNGVFIQVVWIIEGEKKGARSLYNCLPQIQNMDGWVNYLTAVLGQHIVQTYSIEHTAYLIAKFIQGFIEQTLINPVRIGNLRVDRSGQARKEARYQLIGQTDTNHGVTKGSHGLKELLSVLPGINSKVAEGLANTGLSLAEIVNLDKDELKAVKGIGAKTADSIYETFQLRLKN
jgi:ERCC4-type nuclease